jgi:hypothetical protein
MFSALPLRPTLCFEMGAATSRSRIRRRDKEQIDRAARPMNLMQWDTDGRQGTSAPIDAHMEKVGSRRHVRAGWFVAKPNSEDVSKSQ